MLDLFVQNKDNKFYSKYPRTKLWYSQSSHPASWNWKDNHRILELHLGAQINHRPPVSQLLELEPQIMQACNLKLNSYKKNEIIIFVCK